MITAQKRLWQLNKFSKLDEPFGHSDIGILIRGILESIGRKKAQFLFLSVIKLIFPVQALLFLLSIIPTTFKDNRKMEKCYHACYIESFSIVNFITCSYSLQVTIHDENLSRIFISYLYYWKLHATKVNFENHSYVCT
jgi:hypothetical protein